MTISPLTPIVVGVGEVKNASKRPDVAREPLDLILEAIRNAVRDSGTQENSILPTVDSIAVVPPWTWAYEDLPGLVASKLRVKASHLVCGSHGGNQPALLCDQVAQRVSVGESRVAIIAGGEALASLAACQKAGQIPPPGWTAPDPTQPTIDASSLDSQGKNVATRHGMGLAVQVYPFYENGLRSHRRQTYTQNLHESAAMYAEFDKIACSHEYSWRWGATPRNADDIGKITERNRMICTPLLIFKNDPLLMNAFNTVNLAAAAIVTTVEHAERLKIPREKWVYVLGGAGARETEDFWARPCFYRSPALEQTIDNALRASGLTKDDIDCYDFYSCFPVVPKLACRHLGLDIISPSKPISLLGGLTSFGGAGNNYSMHALTEVTRKIRDRTHRNGLILANGGLLTYQHALCLSSEPRKGKSEYPRGDIQPVLAKGLTIPPFDEVAEGDASIETFTVEFDRQGKARNAFIIGSQLKSGRRFLANHGDQRTLRKLCDTNIEPIGKRGYVVTQSDGRNSFFIDLNGKL